MSSPTNDYDWYQGTECEPVSRSMVKMFVMKEKRDHDFHYWERFKIPFKSYTPIFKTYTHFPIIMPRPLFIPSNQFIVSFFLKLSIPTTLLVDPMTPKLLALLNSWQHDNDRTSSLWTTLCINNRSFIPKLWKT